jgi:hypothetical protein
MNLTEHDMARIAERKRKRLTGKRAEGTTNEKGN